MSVYEAPATPALMASSGPIPFLDLGTTTAVVAQEVRVGWEKVIQSNRFVGGEEVDVFEREWASYCGTEYAMGVGNGTDALLLAIRALDLGPGDEIIVPANTFVATVEAIVLAGAIPRFADVDLETGLMGADEVEAAMSDKTRAIVAVHMFGQLTDMDALGRCATRHGRVLIEDAAQAHGATWRGIRAGGFGAVGCFSFYPGKNLGAFGDAGAVVTSDRRIAERIRSMRDHGRPARCGHRALRPRPDRDQQSTRHRPGSDPLGQAPAPRSVECGSPTPGRAVRQGASRRPWCRCASSSTARVLGT